MIGNFHTAEPTRPNRHARTDMAEPTWPNRRGRTGMAEPTRRKRLNRHDQADTTELARPPGPTQRLLGLDAAGGSEGFKLRNGLSVEQRPAGKNSRGVRRSARRVALYTGISL